MNDNVLMKDVIVPEAALFLSDYWTHSPKIAIEPETQS